MCNETVAAANVTNIPFAWHGPLTEQGKSAISGDWKSNNVNVGNIIPFVIKAQMWH